MILRRHLREDQIGGLVDRLRELKVRPGLVVTTLWHAGLLVPPMALMPMSKLRLLWLLVVFGWVYVVLLFIFGNVLPDSSIWHFLLLLLVPQLPWMLTRLVARRRWQAWLVAVLCPAVLIGVIGMLGAQADTIDWIFSHAHLGRWFFVTLLVASLATRYYQRNRDNDPSWQDIVDQQLLPEVF